MTTTTSKSTTKKSGEIKTSSNGLALIESTEAWKTLFDKYNIDKSEVEILVVSNTRKDADYLISNNYKADYISPNKIETNKNIYDIVIATYLNKYMLDEFEKEEIMFQINDKLRPTGDVFLVLTNKDNIEVEWEMVARTNTYSVYFD